MFPCPIGCDSLGIKTINALENSGYDHTKQWVNYESKRVPVKNSTGNDDWLLVFRVYYIENRVVETSDGRIWVRRGESCCELKDDQERTQLRIDKGEIQFELADSLNLYPEDFDVQLLSEYTNRVRDIRRIDSTTDVEILAGTKLGRIDGRRFVPNIACSICFANDPTIDIPGASIHLLKFDGIEQQHGKEFNETASILPFTGPLPRLIKEVDEKLSSFIRRFSGFATNGKFLTTPEYPQDAWRESIVNACVHRSYAIRNMKTFVRMFDDRMEFESPGSFPPGVTPETIYDIQHSRNPRIMQTMLYLGFVKEIGEGTNRIRSEMKKLDLPPPTWKQREENAVTVRVVLQNKIKDRKIWVDDDVASLIGAQITKTLNEKQKLILNFIAIEGRITVSDASRQTGHTWHTAKKILQNLCDRKILFHVKREGVEIDRIGYYVLWSESTQPPS